MPATAIQPEPTKTDTVAVPAIERTYRAEYESGGKVRVKDTPLFAEVTERAGKPQPFDASWLHGALSKDQALRATGYHAPMHFGHQDQYGGAERERAGHFELNRVERRLVEGRPVNVLIGDRVFDTVDKFERAKKGCPYISVEVSPDKPDEVNSAALLSSAAPFHRFPDFATFAASPERMWTFAAAPGQPATYLWRTDMADQAPPKAEDKNSGAAPPFAKKDDAAPSAPAKPEGTAEAVPAGVAPATPAATPPAPSTQPDNLATLVTGMQDIKTIVMSLSAIVAKLAEAGLGGFAGGLGALSAKPPGNGPGTVIPAIAAQAAPPPAPATVTTFTAATNGAPTVMPDQEKAKLEGEVAGLKLKIADLEKQNAEQAYASFAARLGSRFVAFEDELKRRVADGTAKVWVESLERASGPLPGSSPKVGEPAPAASPVGEASEVAAYSAKGKLPEARQAAALFAAVGPNHYLRRKRDSNGNDVGERTLKEFLETQVGE